MASPQTVKSYVNTYGFDPLSEASSQNGGRN